MFDEISLEEACQGWASDTVTVVAIIGDDAVAVPDKCLLIADSPQLRLMACRSAYEAIKVANAAANAGARVAAFLGQLEAGLCRRTGSLAQQAEAGQVQVNHALEALCRSGGGNLHFADVGVHEVEGQQEHIFVCGSGPTPLAPAVASVKQVFIGRQKELGDARQQFEHGRLLTVHGFPGVGTTQFIERYAAEIEDSFPQGRVDIDLRAVTRPEAMMARIHQAIGALKLPEENDVASIVNTLGEQEKLIVIDHIDGVIPHVKYLASKVLSACPNVVFLIGGHRPLKLIGEHLYPLEGLEFPVGVEDWRAIRDFDAVALFEVRARLADPKFEVNRFNAADVGALCARLEGIPLYIEFAVNRLGRTQTPREVLNRLKDQVGTQDGVLNWAHQHLSEQAKKLLRRLSVFQADFTLDWAMQVCSLEEFDDFELLMAIEELVESAFVKVAHILSGHKVFTLGALTRSFAKVKLKAAAEAPKVNRSYKAWTRQLVNSASNGLGSDRAANHAAFDAAFLDLLDTIYSDARSKASADLALETTFLCLNYLMDRGSYRQGYALANRLTEMPHILASTQFPRILTALSAFSYCLGAKDLCQYYAKHALKMAIENEDVAMVAFAWSSYGTSKQMVQRFRSAYRCYRYAMTAFHESGNARTAVTCASNLLSAAIEIGDESLIEASKASALEFARLSQDPLASAHANQILSHYYLEHLQFRKAYQYALKSMMSLRNIEDPLLLNKAAANCGYALINLGHPAESAICHAYSIRLCNEYGHVASDAQISKRRHALKVIESELSVAQWQETQLIAMTNSAYEIWETLNKLAI